MSVYELEYELRKIGVNVTVIKKIKTEVSDKGQKNALEIRGLFV